MTKKLLFIGGGSMDIKKLLEKAKETPPTEQQIKDLKQRLSEQKSEIITKEFLDRTYNL